MKKNICLLFLIIIVTLFNICEVKADSCDSNDIARLTELSQRISYDAKYIGNTKEADSIQSYFVTLNNLGSDFYIKYNKSIYMDGTTVMVESGDVEFKIYSSTCNVKLRTMTIKLKRFNEISDTDICMEMKDILNVCDEWYQGDISIEELHKLVADYNNNSYEDDVGNNYLDLFISIVSSYWFFIVPFVVGIIFIIMFIRIRRNKLD